MGLLPCLGPRYRLLTTPRLLLAVEQSNKYCYQAPDIVRLEKESVLGVFDLGFREKGFSVDMNELRCLLTHPDNSDRIYKVNVPQSDKKKKVDRFQGIGVYVNREFLGSPNNVFVSIFPTGKCTVTAAPSVAQANKVAEGRRSLLLCLQKNQMKAPSPLIVNFLFELKISPLLTRVVPLQSSGSSWSTSSCSAASETSSRPRLRDSAPRRRSEAPPAGREEDLGSGLEDEEEEVLDGAASNDAWAPGTAGPCVETCWDRR